MTRQTIILKSITAILCSILLSSCYSHNNNIKKLVDDIPVDERAYFVGKYSVSCKPNKSKNRCGLGFHGIFLNYKSQNSENTIWDRFGIEGDLWFNSAEADSIDFEKGEASNYFCKILPAGDYSIYSMTYWTHTDGKTYRVKENQYFDIPFKLERMKISNLDHLKLTTTFEKNWMGIHLPFPGVLKLSPLSDQEINKAIEKCPSVAKGYDVTQQKIWEHEFKSPLIDGYKIQH